MCPEVDSHHETVSLKCHGCTQTQGKDMISWSFYLFCVITNFEETRSEATKTGNRKRRRSSVVLNLAQKTEWCCYSLTVSLPSTSSAGALGILLANIISPLIAKTSAQIQTLVSWTQISWWGVRFQLQTWISGLKSGKVLRFWWGPKQSAEKTPNPFIWLIRSTLALMYLQRRMILPDLTPTKINVPLMAVDPEAEDFHKALWDCSS